MILDEQVLYALSPHVYPKPKEINPHSMKPKTKKEIIEENDIFHLTKRKSKLEKNQKIVANINDKFLYDKYDEIKQNLMTNKIKQNSLNQSNINKGFGINFKKTQSMLLNELLNVNNSLVENKYFQIQENSDNPQKFETEEEKNDAVNKNTSTNRIEDADRLYSRKQSEKDFETCEINKQISTDNQYYNTNANNRNEYQTDEYFNTSKIQYSKQKSEKIENKFILTNINNLVSSEARSMINTKFNFRTNGNNIVSDSIQINSDLNHLNMLNFTPKKSTKQSFRDVNTNAKNYSSKKNFQVPNNTTFNNFNSPNNNNYITNTNNAMTQNNQLKSISNVVNFANMNNFKPVMLTGLALQRPEKDNKPLGEKTAEKNIFYKSKYEDRNSFNAFNKKASNFNIYSNYNKPNYLQSQIGYNKNRSLNSNSFNNYNNTLEKKNFTSKNVNQCNSLEIADISIIKPSPHNEQGINALNSNDPNNAFKRAFLPAKAAFTEKLDSKKSKSLDKKRLEKRKLIFNKIYSYNSDFVKRLKEEQNKPYQDLYNYQSKMIQMVAEKTSMDNLRKLTQKLKNIRDISEAYNPVSKVNWKLFGKIIKECGEEMKNIMNYSWREIESIKDSEVFEKELCLGKKKHINLNKKFSKYETSLKRISPFIPEYLVEKFKNTLKIIN